MARGVSRWMYVMMGQSQARMTSLHYGEIERWYMALGRVWAVWRWFRLLARDLGNTMETSESDTCDRTRRSSGNDQAYVRSE